MPSRFHDRRDAGKQLAKSLGAYAGRHDVIVLALPRGGVPVGYEVARALDAPLDVFIVRKLGVPGQEELAMGAIASGGIRVLDRALIEQLHIPDLAIERVEQFERRELERRERLYGGAHHAPDVHGQVVILVDDGIATGASMHAAIDALRQQEPKAIVVAAPVGAPETCSTLGLKADACACLSSPRPFYGVGMWYEDFDQTTDDEVRALLEDADRRHEAPAHP